MAIALKQLESKFFEELGFKGLELHFAVTPDFDQEHEKLAKYLSGEADAKLYQDANGAFHLKVQLAHAVDEPLPAVSPSAPAVAPIPATESVLAEAIKAAEADALKAVESVIFKAPAAPTDPKTN